ncbi:MAG: DcrB-related protein [Polyangiaceae bacterium]|nr:DcrB-related protein [Polyangiaceae bacterium]
MLYFTNEAKFELPDVGFVDRTVNVLDAKLDNGRTLGVLVARSRLAEGTGLKEAVEAHQDQERKSLRGWTSLQSEWVEIDGLPAIEVAIQWRADEGMTYQRQLHVLAGDEVLLLVVNGTLEDRAASDATMDFVRSTFSLRR